VRDYFVRWPAHSETQFVWQTDLGAIARHLDSARDVPTDMRLGAIQETMDNDSLHLLMKRRDLAR